ncbi:Hypothetical_protein [Hexamita inflata]|uniref:Hypothetical_protein n=1 Tax=Hexamita inflata TaxID=28002 RepID=A0AA86QIS6_9EUKA|nr:Hypothetical protein HINF_LOCUS47135 [Hexamita inflata]
MSKDMQIKRSKKVIQQLLRQSLTYFDQLNVSTNEQKQELFKYLKQIEKQIQSIMIALLDYPCTCMLFQLTSYQSLLAKYNIFHNYAHFDFYHYYKEQDQEFKKQYKEGSTKSIDALRIITANQKQFNSPILFQFEMLSQFEEFASNLIESLQNKFILQCIIDLLARIRPLIFVNITSEAYIQLGVQNHIFELKNKLTDMCFNLAFRKQDKFAEELRLCIEYDCKMLQKENEPKHLAIFLDFLNNKQYNDEYRKLTGLNNELDFDNVADPDDNYKWDEKNQVQNLTVMILHPNLNLILQQCSLSFLQFRMM